MTDFLSNYPPEVFLLPLLLVAFLLALLVVYRRRNRNTRLLKKTFGAIAHDRIDHLIIPSADDGEIQIDHLLLTTEGLLIVDIKDVSGAVFGGDKMQEWSVISHNHRFTFSNPQNALYDRIAAVRQIVHQVPVTGRVLFLNDAEFKKGVPGLVSTLESLQEEFSELDEAVVRSKIEAFKPQWDLIREKALPMTIERRLKSHHL